MIASQSDYDSERLTLQSFAKVYGNQVELGESLSPRDARRISHILTDFCNEVADVRSSELEETLNSLQVSEILRSGYLESAEQHAEAVRVLAAVLEAVRPYVASASARADNDQSEALIQLGELDHVLLGVAP